MCISDRDMMDCMESIILIDICKKSIRLNRLSGEIGHIRLEIKFCSMRIKDLEMFYIII